MSFVTLQGGLILPHFPRADRVVTSLALNAAAEKFALIIRVPKSGTLDQFEFAGNQTTLNGASRVRLSFQNVVVASGDPDGIQDEFRDMAVGDFAAADWQKPPGVMTDDGTGGGVKRVVTKGDLLACVIEYDVFTASDDIFARVYNVLTPRVEFRFPYASYDSGAGYVLQDDEPLLALKYSDGSFAEIAPNVLPIFTDTDEIAYNSGSTPDEIGIRFRLPFPVKISAVWVNLSSLPNNAGTDLVLYDSDGTTVLSTVSIEPHATPVDEGIHFHYLSSVITLSKDTFYRLAVKPTTVNDIKLAQHTVDAASLMDVLTGGQDFHRSHRTDGGGWSEDTVRRPMVGIYVTAFDAGTLGGPVGRSFSRGMVT